jgi:hypothetical protein
MGDEETKAAEEKAAAEKEAEEKAAADKAAADKAAAKAEADKDKEEMVPASRIRGLAKEKAAMEAKLKKVQKQLDLKNREGLSEAETVSLEREEEKARVKEMEETLAKAQGKLKLAALRNYLDDARSPEVIKIVPDDLIDLDDDDLLTTASKSAIDAWKRKPNVSGMFNPAKRGGNSPLAGDGRPITEAEYNKIKRDSTKSPEERQAAHVRYLASIRARR